MTHVINWTRAIETNREALEQVVEEIFGLLKLALTGTPKLWPHEIQAMVRRLLRPTESALRRLIIIMARDVKVKLPPKRPMPKGLKIARSVSGHMAFRLYDTRKRFAAETDAKREDRRGPRIHFFHGPGPLVPAPVPQKRKPNPATLFKRYASLKSALEDLPRQTKRMALWRLRRQAKENVKFKSPLRPGQPPGHQKRPRFTIDRVLAICHGLAHEALYANTS
jgi:hypothetical protein